MLRTLADRADARPCVLLYATPSWEQVAHADELERLGERLDLQVVYVLEEIPEDGHVESGTCSDLGRGAPREEGYVDAEMLDRYLGDWWPRARYFICGPPPMMDAVESALLERGVSADHIEHERFAIQ